MDIHQDTRDKVINLLARFENIEDRVAKNSVILDELHAYVTTAKTGVTIGKTVLGFGKYVTIGTVASGLTWLSQHFPKGISH